MLPVHSSPRQKPTWQLPPGVARGTWDYVTNDAIADDYDDYFQFNDLFEYDVAFALTALQQADITPPARLIDFGSGTARALLPLIKEGYRGLAVDLSQRMLEVARAKASRAELPLDCLRANLVELAGVADDAADGALCLFSTLGMIRGRAHRQTMLRHIRRIVRPGGLFVLHVHNYWYNLYDPGGPWWLLRNALEALSSKDVQRGDKYYPYRNVQNMFLHVFTRRELRRDLRQAGFRSVTFSPLDRSRHQGLTYPYLLPDLRANGWMIACQ